MVHGVFNPQYQRYGKKILVGTYLKLIGGANMHAAIITGITKKWTKRL
jgi:hypothetical protein